MGIEEYETNVMVFVPRGDTSGPPWARRLNSFSNALVQMVLCDDWINLE